MNISKIVVQNFRSIKFGEIEPSALSIFVGQNNHGKTNFFEAIDWFFNGLGRGEEINEIRHGKTGSEEVFVEIEFQEVEKGIGWMRHEVNKTKISKLLDGLNSISIRRTSKNLKNRILIVEGKEIEKSPIGIDNAMNDFLPKFEYVDTKKFYEDIAKFGKSTPIGTMLSGVIETLLEENSDYQEFKEKFDHLFGSETSEVKIELDKLSGKVKIYLEKQFPDSVKVEFTVEQPSFEELLKNFNTTIDDGVVTNVSEKGDGMQRALMLAIIQTYADYRKENEEFGKSFLFLIDEAELHLHPSAQRNLKTALHELSLKDDQVLINTHSSVFVADELDGQSIFRVEKIRNKTNINLVSEQEKQSVVYELLGGSPSDLLLPRNFLIVEGKSEEAFLTGVIQRFYQDKPRIQVIYAEGEIERQSGSMDSINKAYVPLGISSPIYKERLVILIDKPNSKKKEKNKKEFLKAYPHLSINKQFFELPKESLEEYYPGKWKKAAEDVKKMSKIQNEKLLYARKVASELAEDEFEKEMEIIFSALKQSWDQAYQ